MAETVDPKLSIVGISGSRTEVLVSGVADLPDGTRLRCGVWHGTWEGPFDGVIYQDTRTVNGRFDCRFEPTHPWIGTVSASVELRADRDQPEHVQARIGRRGEHLAYSDAQGDDFAVVVAVETRVLS